MATQGNSLFLVGTGFIGGTLLTDLLASKKYKISALTRKDDQAKKLKELGVRPIKGSLSDEDVLVKATLEHDIVIHAATADDEDSVRAIVKGLSQKSKDANSVYIHTSGTGVLTDPNASHGNETSTKFYSDIDNQDVDSLPDSAYHRNVDLIIKRAVDAKQLGSSKVAIMLPPLIYGLGTGPFNRTSIQVPGWAAESAKAKQVTIVGKGIAIWNNIHVQTLATAYTTLLDSLVSAKEQPESLYCFAETGEHKWGDLGLRIDEALRRHQLVEKPVAYGGPASYLGSNSRSKADRLRKLGWSGKEKDGVDVFKSVDAEIDYLVKTGTLEDQVVH